MKPKLLLHSCCAPCSSAVIERLKPDFDVTVFYYNPNIYPQVEYERRREEQIMYCQKIGVAVIVGDYVPSNFSAAIRGQEHMPERSPRCFSCYKFRLEKTADLAKEKGFEYFTTTLSVSPHKNANWINEIGKSLETDSCKFSESNFKKQNGYLRSLQLSKENGFYRQDYCGCEMSFLARKNRGEK